MKPYHRGGWYEISLQPPGPAKPFREDMMNKTGTMLDKRWHLATNEYEVDLTEFEFSVLRLAAAFERWRSDCIACTCDHSFSGADVAVLHVVRQHDRPKSISEIGRLLNRDDLSNLQYGIRKLVNAGVIKKAGKSDNKKGATYVVTDLGCEITDKFAEFRRELLIPLTRSVSADISLVDATRVLSLLSGIYDQASCIAAAHRAGR